MRLAEPDARDYARSYPHAGVCLWRSASWNGQEAWCNLGSLLRDWGRGEESLRAFDRAIAIDTAYVYAYHLRGLCRHGMGDHKGAQVDFMRGLFYDNKVKQIFDPMHSGCSLPPPPPGFRC